jgi:hypothetical protein
LWVFPPKNVTLFNNYRKRDNKIQIIGGKNYILTCCEPSKSASFVGFFPKNIKSQLLN